MASILKYHVIPGRVHATNPITAGQANTLQDQFVKIVVNGSDAMVNDANLLATDLDASIGVIHVIDSVILPPDINPRPFLCEGTVRTTLPLNAEIEELQLWMYFVGPGVA